MDKDLRNIYQKIYKQNLLTNYGKDEGAAQDVSMCLFG